MKNLLLFILLLCSFTTFGQNCIKIDTVYSSVKSKQLSSLLGNRNICFGIKQVAEEEISNKYCISDKGEPVKIEIFYFGVPNKSLRIAGIEKTDQVTQVGIKIYYKNKEYKGIGESETEVRATMIQLSDEGIPFSKMTVSSAIKKAIQECVTQLP
jgi:hypothetical protein